MKGPKRYRKASEWLRRAYPARKATWHCLASDFIAYLAELPRNIPVVLYCRVSSWQQARRRNLANQKSALRHEVEALGFKVLCVYGEIGSGWRDDLERRAEAHRFASEQGAVLVAESLSRFLRNRQWRPSNPVRPTDQDHIALGCATRGAWLATLVHPDEKDHPAQIRRGMREKLARPGPRAEYSPGRKRALRERNVAEAKRLRGEGHSLRYIARALRISLSTVRGWLVS